RAPGGLARAPGAVAVDGNRPGLPRGSEQPGPGRSGRTCSACRGRRPADRPEELGGLLAKLRADGYQPAAAGSPPGGMPVRGPLATILPSHSLLHAAEGELFRDALIAAAEHHRVTVSRPPPGDLVAGAARHLNWNQQSVLSTLAEMGRRIGPPWRKDEKDAALTAWLALAG